MAELGFKPKAAGLQSFLLRGERHETGYNGNGPEPLHTRNWHLEEEGTFLPGVLSPETWALGPALLPTPWRPETSDKFCSLTSVSLSSRRWRGWNS